MCTIDNTLFKKIIIIFWALWWLLAVWTDVVGVLAHLKIIVASWAPDTNYPFLVSSLSIYNVASWVPSLLFAFILLWSFISTGLFCWASCGLMRDQDVWIYRAEIAFIVSITYWLAFFISDQLVMKFDLEENHMVQGGFELLSYFSLYLLPSKSKPNYIG